MTSDPFLSVKPGPLDADRDVVVFFEPLGPFAEGRNLHLLMEGQRLAEKLGGTLSVMALDDVDLIPLDGSPCRVTTLFLLHPSGAPRAPYPPEIAVRAATALLAQLRPRMVLLADGDFTRETAPALAHRLGSAALHGVRSVRVESCPESGRRSGPDRPIAAQERLRVVYAQAVWGGQLDVEVTFPAGTIEVAGLSLAPVPSPLAEHEEGVEANEGILPTRFDTVRVEVSVESGFSPPQRLSLTPPDYHDVDISYAERVLAVGAGAATRELLPQIERLADLLRASLATTRPVVDDGLLPKERMVGQTGRSVAPDLYLAFGISGSPHHVAGFQEAGTVLTLNSDVRAPILQFSDMSYLGRAEEIIPLLVARLEEWREGEGS